VDDPTGLVDADDAGADDAGSEAGADDAGDAGAAAAGGVVVGVGPAASAPPRVRLPSR